MQATIASSETPTTLATLVPTETPTSQATLVPIETPTPQATLVPIETPTPQATIVSPVSPTVSAEWTQFVQARLVGSSCPAVKILPGEIDPSALSREEFYQLFSEAETWLLAPDETGRIRASLAITSIVEGTQWIQLENSVQASIEVYRNVPDHSNIVFVAGCGGIGEVREFPALTLESEFDAYRTELTFPGADFFSLQPGEFEVFGLEFQCSAPGVYRLALELPFSSVDHAGTVTLADTPEFACPQSFTMWDPSSAETLQFAGEYLWRETGYEKTR
ncbi:MAG TPA: hypothetical protein VER55_12680 [Ardenticatenaceae bacterium]|nr:hypothetical protein [Ardenticatenaceae bacterium]